MQNLDNNKRRDFLGNGAKALASMGLLGLMANVAFGTTKSQTPPKNGKDLKLSQIAQSWLLHKKPFIVPITGTSKLAHLEENLHSTQIRLSQSEIKELEKQISAIKIIGDRYNQKEQSQVR